MFYHQETQIQSINESFLICRIPDKNGCLDESNRQTEDVV